MPTAIKSTQLGGSDDIQVSTKVRAFSANWDGTFNTVNTLSANWDSTYTTVNANSASWGPEIADYITPYPLTSDTSISWNVLSGVNTTLTLAHNATVTLSNLADGEEATTTLIQGASAYSLTLAHAGLSARGTTDVTTLANGEFAIISIKRTGSNMFVQANTNFN